MSIQSKRLFRAHDGAKTNGWSQYSSSDAATHSLHCSRRFVFATFSHIYPREGPTRRSPDSDSVIGRLPSPIIFATVPPPSHVGAWALPSCKSSPARQDSTSSPRLLRASPRLALLLPCQSSHPRPTRPTLSLSSSTKSHSTHRAPFENTVPKRPHPSVTTLFFRVTLVPPPSSPPHQHVCRGDQARRGCRGPARRRGVQACRRGGPACRRGAQACRRGGQACCRGGPPRHRGQDPRGGPDRPREVCRAG